jgi:hypothetical protein
MLTIKGWLPVVVTECRFVGWGDVHYPIRRFAGIFSAHNDGWYGFVIPQHTAGLQEEPTV